MGSRVGRSRFAGGIFLEVLGRGLERQVEAERCQDRPEQGDELELFVAGVAREHAHDDVPRDANQQNQLEDRADCNEPVVENLLHDVLLKGARLFPPWDSSEE